MKREKVEGNNNKVYYVLIVLIILFGIILGIFLIKEKHEKENRINVEKNPTRSVTDYISFFAIQNIINKYLFSYNEEEIYNMLDEDYIKNNDITVDNVIEKAKKGLVGMNYKCQKVLENNASNRYKDVYVTSGIIIENTMEDTNVIDKDFKAIVILDYDNLTFSIIPNTNDIKESLKDREKIIIEKNKYNAMPKTGVRDYYDICSTYYNDFVFKLNYMLDDGYKLLDTDSKDKYSKEELYKVYGGFTTLKSCKYDSESVIYVATGNNDKVIRFKETNVMDYSVYLE